MIYVYPYFARNNKNKIWLLKQYKRIIRWFGLFNIILSMLCFLGAKYIICIVFGQQYVIEVNTFRVLSISYFFSATFRVVAGNLLITQRKYMFNLWTSIFSSIINILLNIIFVKKIGAIGAAWATLTISCVTGFVSTGYLIHVFNRIGAEDN